MKRIVSIIGVLAMATGFRGSEVQTRFALVQKVQKYS